MQKLLSSHVLGCGFPPCPYRGTNTDTVAKARPEFQRVLLQSSVLSRSFVLLRKHLLMSLMLLVRHGKICISSFCLMLNFHSCCRKSLQNRYRKSSASICVKMSMGENYHAKPCSSTAEPSLLVFPLFSNC